MKDKCDSKHEFKNKSGREMSTMPNCQVAHHFSFLTSDKPQIEFVFTTLNRKKLIQCDCPGKNEHLRGWHGNIG